MGELVIRAAGNRETLFVDKTVNSLNLRTMTPEPPLEKAAVIGFSTSSALIIGAYVATPNPRPIQDYLPSVPSAWFGLGLLLTFMVLAIRATPE